MAKKVYLCSSFCSLRFMLLDLPLRDHEARRKGFGFCNSSLWHRLSDRLPEGEASILLPSSLSSDCRAANKADAVGLLVEARPDNVVRRILEAARKLPLVVSVLGESWDPCM